MERLPRGAGVVFRAFGRAELMEQARDLRRLARRRGLVFIVGNDARLAGEIRADGLHLPEKNVPYAIDRRRWPKDFIITAAAHSLRAMLRAERAGVDGLVVSAVFASASPSAGHPLGVTRLAARARWTTSAVYALGGVNTRTARRLSGNWSYRDRRDRRLDQNLKVVSNRTRGAGICGSVRRWVLSNWSGARLTAPPM